MIEIKDEGSSFKEGREKKITSCLRPISFPFKEEKSRVLFFRILINNVNSPYSSTLSRLSNRKILSTKERKFGERTKRKDCSKGIETENESSKWTEKRKQAENRSIKEDRLLQTRSISARKGLINQPACSRQLFSLVLLAREEGKRSGLKTDDPNRFLSVSKPTR